MVDYCPCTLYFLMTSVLFGILVDLKDARKSFNWIILSKWSWFQLKRKILQRIGIRFPKDNQLLEVLNFYDFRIYLVSTSKTIAIFLLFFFAAAKQGKKKTTVKKRNLKEFYCNSADGSVFFFLKISSSNLSFANKIKKNSKSYENWLVTLRTVQLTS